MSLFMLLLCIVDGSMLSATTPAPLSLSRELAFFLCGEERKLKSEALGLIFIQYAFF
jgi:hypothetical protein